MAQRFRLKIPSAVIIIFSLLLLYGTWRFYQSSLLIAQGNLSLKQGNPEQAIVIYLKAYNLFPFRFDVIDDLKGARLMLESDAVYGTLYQISAQVQEVPPISAIPQVPLKPNEYRVPILMYHHIRDNPRPSDPVWAALNVSVSQLDAQLQYLADHNFHTITLDELNSVLQGQGKLPPNPVVLTFDDGYSSFYYNAFPLLRKYKMKAVSFVITDVTTALAYMSWDQIMELDRSGLVQFGAHTKHHPSLVYLSADLVVDEVKGSKNQLESHLHKPINWFAYPYGSYNSSVIQAVKGAGFVGAVSTIYGSVQSQEKIYLLPRIMVDGRYTLDNLARRLTL